MTFGEAIRACYQKSLVFNGRASRTEYWWFFLFALLVALVVSIVTVPILISAGSEGSFSASKLATLGFVYLAMFIVVGLPGLAVTVRRLHDTSRSGWYYFLVLVPLVGPIILLVFVATPGDPGANSYGEPPVP